MPDELPMTPLPDGSGCFTATILSKEEVDALPLKSRPLCHRLSSDLYHKIFESVGAASMCWEPTPPGIFDPSKAEKIAVDLCFAVANEIEDRKPTQADLDEAHALIRMRESEMKTLAEGLVLVVRGLRGNAIHAKPILRNNPAVAEMEFKSLEEILWEILNKCGFSEKKSEEKPEKKKKKK